MKSRFAARALGLGLALALVGLAGCSTPSIPACTSVPDLAPEYVLVEYRYGGQYGKAPLVEVKDTPQYVERRSVLKSAAIRFPDSCLNESAAKVSGLSDSTQTILQTTCGPWLGEIEKALVGAGYRVISWDALWKLEKQRNLSTYNAGKELGADVVFVFNSLEAGNIVGGSSSQGNFKYFESDPSGSARAPKGLDEPTRVAFKASAQTGVRLLQGAGKEKILALSSIIDTTAVLTETGQSVWFYTRSTTIPTSEKRGMKFLFGRYPGQPYQLVAPTRTELVSTSVAPVSTLSSEDTEETNAAAGVDPYQAKRLQLIRTGAAELVRAFQGGGR